MKRVLPILAVSLLFVSGWGRVLAAAVCPQMQVMATCPMKANDHSPASHEAMGMGEMHGMQMSETAVSDGEINAINLPAASCAHCLTGPEHPTSTVLAVKGAGQPDRDAGAAPGQPVKSFKPPAPSFVPPALTGPHSPPGTSTARHILVGVFRI